MAWGWIGQIQALGIGDHSWKGGSFKVQDAVFCDDHLNLVYLWVVTLTWWVRQGIVLSHLS